MNSEDANKLKYRSTQNIPSIFVDDLVGKKFWKMTVLKFCGINEKGRSIWLCKCDCGNKTKTNNLGYGTHT